MCVCAYVCFVVICLSYHLGPSILIVLKAKYVFLNIKRSVNSSLMGNWVVWVNPVMQKLLNFVTLKKKVL